MLGVGLEMLSAESPLLERLTLPLSRLKPPSWFDTLLNYPPVKALLPIPIMIAIAPLIWLFFRRTWQRLDEEAAAYRASIRASEQAAGPRRMTPLMAFARLTGRSRSPRADELLLAARRRTAKAVAPIVSASTRAQAALKLYSRPAACFVITAVMLTMQEYYGGRTFYDELIRPALADYEAAGHHLIKMAKYEEYYSYCWWSFSRVAGYVLIPFPVWKLLFPKDSLLDLGLRTRGFLSHIWIYGLCLLIVVPVIALVATQPDFGTYYPFYKNASRSWFDFIIWEAIYWLQFLTLEMFFRGFMLGALRRTMGSAAIFAMAVPYCMIHYGKPYLEAHGAVVAGIVLGSLAMRTRSIWAGFLVHISVAVMMDSLALWRRAALPVSFWAPG